MNVRELYFAVFVRIRFSKNSQYFLKIVDINYNIADAPELEVNGPCEVEFKDVSFTYPRRGASAELSPVIRGISFKIGAGKTVAVVGHSGSGKTTISRLLCRFYDPETGSVTVNGRDIRSVSQTSLRKHIGVVPQVNLEVLKISHI